MILTCVTTYNRLRYTRRTLASLVDTGGPVVAVDNASTDGTRDWLATDIFLEEVVLNDINLFPGAATNIGWHRGLKRFPDATLLHRSDNDIEYLPGWQVVVTELFNKIPRLGQLGVLNCHEDHPDGVPFEVYEENGAELFLANPGGNSVIRRDLWDSGLRWDPGAWSPGGMDEDSRLSQRVRELGYLVGRVIPTIANNISFHRFEDFPDYYRETAALRGLVAETSV